jgi:hypothetical protein
MQCGDPHQEKDDHRYHDYRDDHVPQAFPGIGIMTSHAARLARLTCPGAISAGNRSPGRTEPALTRGILENEDDNRE